MNSLITDNGQLQKLVKNNLSAMKQDIDVSKAGPKKDEPEFRVK